MSQKYGSQYRYSKRSCPWLDHKSPAHRGIHPVALVVEDLHRLDVAVGIGIDEENRLVARCYDMAAVGSPGRILPRSRLGDGTRRRFAAVRGRSHDAPLAGLERGPAELSVLRPVGARVLATLRRVPRGGAGCDVADVYLGIAGLIGDVCDFGAVGAPARAGLGRGGGFGKTDYRALGEVHRDFPDRRG